MSFDGEMYREINPASICGGNGIWTMIPLTVLSLLSLSIASIKAWRDEPSSNFSSRYSIPRPSAFFFCDLIYTAEAGFSPTCILTNFGDTLYLALRLSTSLFIPAFIFAASNLPSNNFALILPPFAFCFEI